MKIQYVSDIHLETRKQADFEKILKPTAPILALCGDIGYPRSSLYLAFLQYCSSNFEYVFYVAGNHEFYNDTKTVKFQKYKHLCDDNQREDLEKKYKIETIGERLEKIKKVCANFPNIHFLDNTFLDIPGTNITIVGCTLWSNLDVLQYLIVGLNDFVKIYENSHKVLTKETYNKMNKEDKEFLKQTIDILQQISPERQIIILTHHCPTFEILNDIYLESDPQNINSLFANKDLEHLFGKNVKAWLCGHTHGCKTKTIKETIISTNTYGYEGENVEGFSTEAVIEI
jgi:predicted MPP superfamily phosphohydrolase